MTQTCQYWINGGGFKSICRFVFNRKSISRNTAHPQSWNLILFEWATNVGYFACTSKSSCTWKRNCHLPIYWTHILGLELSLISVRTILLQIRPATCSDMVVFLILPISLNTSAQLYNSPFPPSSACGPLFLTIFCEAPYEILRWKTTTKNVRYEKETNC